MRRLAVWRARRRGVRVAAALVLALGLLAAPLGASAQEDEGEADPLAVRTEAYWTNPAPQAIPDVLVEEFPPEVSCIIWPRLCGEETAPITEPIDETRPKKDDAEREPIQPVPEDSLPVGRSGGVPRYVSALAFDLPPTPSGQEIARFTLILQERQPTFSADSPAFRQAVLAVLVGYQEGEEAFREQFLKILKDREQYPPVDDEILGLEACPVIEEFEAGDNQEWETQPEMDCILGASGVREEDGTWRFDLTWAAQAWESGEIANLGVAVGPLAAPNVAYGEPDPSDHAQVTLSGAETDEPPLAIIEYREQVEPAAFTLDEAEPVGGESVGGDATVATTPSGGAPSGEVFGGPASGSPDVAEGTAPPVGGEQAPAVASGEPEPQAIRAVRGGATTPTYAWALLALGAAGLFAVGRMLTADPVPATGRRGAMSRLIEARRAGTLTDAPSTA